MKEFFVWWVGAEAVGLAAFPLTFAFFRRLPDRGFAFTKVVGLLLLGYGLWIGAVIGLFPNSRGSVILLLLLIAGLSVIAAGRYREELTGFLRTGWRYIALVEVMFLVVLAGAVFLRSFAPEIVWGEKQFEFAFLNAIDRSEFFPPSDPWLAGNSISYYYFGYVIIDALTKLVDLSTNVTFYLGLSLIAALASVTAFGLVYNMIAVSRRSAPSPTDGPAVMPRAVGFGLAASGLMLIVSNLTGIFEMMARYGIGSQRFYGLLNIDGLTSNYDCAGAPAGCSEWYPTPFWWWWKATRMGSAFDVQEFPFFSFQFGDLHPHVVVIPFVLTLLAVVFQVILGARDGPDAGGDGETQGRLRDAVFGWRSLGMGALLGGVVLTVVLALGVRPMFAVVLALLVAVLQTFLGALAEGWDGDEEEGEERLDALWAFRHPWRFVFLALLLGGTAFIDAWAVPLTVLALVAAAAIANWQRSGGRPLRVLADSVGFILPLLPAMYLFFLPFYLDLDSAVEGVRVNQVTRSEGGYPPPNSESTRPLHFLLFWLPIMWVALSFIAAYAWSRRRELFGRVPLALASLLWVVPIVSWAAVVVARAGFSGLVDELSEREASLITVLVLAVFITFVGLSFLHQLRRRTWDQDRGQLFAFQLAGFALLMMLGVEFFYVKDLFSWRVNTVFRFWHQSWIILSIVGGFGLYRLTLNWRLPRLRVGQIPWQRLAGLGIVFGAAYTVLVAVEPWDVLYAKWWTATLGMFIAGASIVGLAVASAVQDARPRVAWQRLAWVGLTTVILAAALVFPVTVTFERTGGFRNPQSLNGLAYVQKGDPTEYEAIEWLKRTIVGDAVVLEAVGPDYSDFARVSARTGLSTVMGWPGHELQWRGYGTYTTGALVETTLTEVQGEVATIYNTTDIEQARALMDKYEVEYVYVGRLERGEYEAAGLAKFGDFMTPVFENEAVSIFRMPDQEAAAARTE